MSRIGKLPIPLADGVSINKDAGNLISVKGPKGEMELAVNPEISVEVEDGQVLVKRPSDQKRHRAMHGLYRSLINNMIHGVTEGFSRKLTVLGVGFKAEVNNDILELALGYSHPIYFIPPEGVDISVEVKGREAPIITISGIDNQLVGQTAAKIRNLRPPEPYKGKGVRYVDEYVRRKAGKTAGA